MEKLLVTGASGFLGSRVAAFYRDRYDVCAPGRGELDITDADGVRAAFRRIRPRFVVHCAAVSDTRLCEQEPERSWAVNVDGSRNIAEAAAEFHAKCLLCSSDQVYFGSGETGAHRETEALQPTNLYGREKHRAEAECLSGNPDCVLLRLTWMYDRTRLETDRKRGDFLRTLVGGHLAAERMEFPLHDRRGITDASEVVRNLEKAFALPGGIYNFGSPNGKNMFETALAVFEALGWDASLLRENRDAYAGAPRNLSMDPGKANAYGILFSDTVEALARNGIS